MNNRSHNWLIGFFTLTILLAAGCGGGGGGGGGGAPGAPIVGGGGPGAEVACADTLDNDADGLVDLADPDCQVPEIGLVLCADGLDNDGDGDVDVADTDCPDPGTAQLTWTAPTTNIDGTPITDLLGYNIYRQAIAGACPITLATYTLIPPLVAGSGVTVTIASGLGTGAPFIDTLAAGDYCYAVTAVDVTGLESVPAFLATAITVVP